eukprot:1851599-Amphidinium_carterae.1
MPSAAFSGKMSLGNQWTEYKKGNFIPCDLSAGASVSDIKDNGDGARNSGRKRCALFDFLSMLQAALGG